MNNTSSETRDPLKQQVMKSLAWLGGLKYSGQIITWCITIYVIRLLNPSDYGLMAMAQVCIGFLTMVSELGLGAAIVQREKIDEHELKNILGFVLLTNSGLTILLFAVSPLLARYFSEPRVVPILKILSVNFVLLSLYLIPQAMLLRNMNFRSKSIVDLIVALFSASTVLILAIHGYGVWALVCGAITTHLFSVFGYSIFSHTFIMPSFSFKGMKNFFYFGGFFTGARILWYFYSKSDIFIGGRFLCSKVLGTYSVALELSSVPLEKFLPIINQVAFPAYSHIQSDLRLVSSHFLKSVRIVSLFVFPIFWGMLIVAPEIISLLLGSKWHGVILPLQILCIIMPFRALSTLFGPMMHGIGRPDVSFVNVAIASVLMPLAFLIGVKWGVSGICLSWVFGYALVFLIMSKRSLKILGMSLVDFFSNIRTPFIAALVMLIVVFAFKYHIAKSLAPLSTTLLLILVGSVLYTFSVFILNPETWSELRLLFPKTKKAKAN